MKNPVSFDDLCWLTLGCLNAAEYGRFEDDAEDDPAKRGSSNISTSMGVRREGGGLSGTVAGTLEAIFVAIGRLGKRSGIALK